MRTNFYFRNNTQRYRSEDIQWCSIKQKEWRDKTYEKNHKKQYYEDNEEKIRSLQKKYYDENRNVIIKKSIEYEKNRLTTDVKYRLIKNTRQ